MLYCVRAAPAGGENGLVDHEVVYIMLRDENPDYVRALMQPDAMTIPANTEQGTVIRPARSGPVLTVEPESGTLHMRYSARARNIVWKQDRADLYDRIVDNVLHNRSGFSDSDTEAEKRLLIRARFYDRIAHEGHGDSPEAAQPPGQSV